MVEIPLLDLKREYQYMEQDIKNALHGCLEHQSWILGPEVLELEKRIGAYLGSKNVMGVASGTDALVLSLRAIAIKLKGQEYFDKKDKIITTSFTFTATGDAILRSGATPLFVDIDPVTYNINPKKIRECFTRSDLLNVIGIIPVHLYGQACDMDEILAIANENNWFVLEDVAQAFGGDWKGKKLGTLGKLGCFSFFPTKNLGGYGDGGIVVTDHKDLAELVRVLGKHGGENKYNVSHIGYNSRLDTIQATVLLAKLKYVDEFNEQREKIASLYLQELSNIRGISLPACSSNSHVYHQFTIRILNGKRDELREKLKEKDISTAIYYPIPLHKMKVFDGRCEIAGNLIETEKASEEVLSLPINPLLKEEEIKFVCETIKKLL